MLNKATSIEHRYEQLKSQIDSLPQTTLHKAFKGELVEQLDSDGSAVELLKEIEEMKAKSKLKSKSKNIRSVQVR
ncbi:type I restriction-modification system [Nonlabens tegetincola]|uniref:Type I restriction-modification system n=2 Tax=Nonlabens tegetincola TaxID=323273 RepID=A0A090Q031_9FLAO|nr:type I restriction-modification system [Nonlabens tegetincola]